MRTGVPIVWTAPVGSASGYAEEARNAILAVDRAGYAVHVDPLAWTGWEIGLSSAAAGRIERLIALDPPARFMHVIHATPESFYRHPLAVRHIGRTMFETDRIPFEWVARCNALDELWVPSEFNIESFAGAGVAREKLHRVPAVLNREMYESPEPLELPGASGFVFLCVTTWGLRKGWDVLVRAYLEEFAETEDVTLVLAVRPAVTQLDLAGFVRAELGREVSQAPRLVVLPLALSDMEMPGLYRAADAYVMPSRGEGWGRPFMEAMACGLPTIGTRWSGQLEFMNDENSYLVDCEVVEVDERAARESPAYFGHRWAEPSLEHLRELMRRVATDRREGQRKGRRARREVLARYSWKKFAEAIGERLAAAGAGAPAASRKRRKTVVAWDESGQHGFNVVAGGLRRALLGTGRVDITEESGRADVEVRHCWPPDLERRSNGRLVVYQPWEWGSFPKTWIEPLHAADEVWVPTSYVRECAVRSGLAEERVAVVPYGVDPLAFHLRAGRLDLPTGKGFKFLFVGGTIKRKGFDILLRAYLEAFEARDDVTLVVKDAGGDSFYRGQTLRHEIRSWQADVDAPELLYLDIELPRALMPSLYATCDCLVAPYRGEGFGLPIIEAMACGLPVIVPEHGACLDYCTPDVAHLIPAEEHHAPAPFVGELETVEGPWWAEVDRLALIESLRRVVERPEEARAVGVRASDRVRRRFSWNRAADVAVERLEGLRGPGRRASRQRPQPRPTLSGCTIVRDAVRLDYPLEASILTYYPICDEVVVLYDSSSTDGTEELVAALARSYPRVRPVGSEWLVTGESGAEIGRQTDRAIAACTGDWVLYVQADEAIHERDHPAIAETLHRDDVCGARFERRMFLGTLEQEIPEYYVRGLLRLFRAGTAGAAESAMTCALVPGEQRTVLDEGWLLFDYGRVGEPEAILRRKRALQAFHQASEEGVAAALAGELAQTVSPYPAEAHPREARARLALKATRETDEAPVTLAVLVGPGEGRHAARFATRFADWPGDVALIDDSRGDGGCATLQEELVAYLGRGRIRVEEWPVETDFAAGRNRAHELARGQWILHADVDELWEPELVAAVPRLVRGLETLGRTVCGFRFAHSVDGVLANDISPSELTADGLRRAAANGQSRPQRSTIRHRLVRRHERWVSPLHEFPEALIHAPQQAAVSRIGWVFHSKSLIEQRRRDEAYRRLAQAPKTRNLRDSVLSEAVSRLPAGPIVVVETGTLRNPSSEASMGDGWSTLRLARLLADRGDAGSRLYSIDASAEAVSIARDVVPSELRRWVEWVHGDSRAVLAELPVDRIDLLYLDSADDAHVIQEEFLLASRLLGPRSVVVVDDTGSYFAGPLGKGTLLIPAAAAAGWQVDHRKGDRGRMTILTQPA